MSSLLRRVGQLVLRVDAIRVHHSLILSRLLLGSEGWSFAILKSCKISTTISSVVYPDRSTMGRFDLWFGECEKTDIRRFDQLVKGEFRSFGKGEEKYWSLFKMLGKGCALLLAGMMSVGSLVGCGGEEVVVEQVLTLQEEDAVLVEVGQRSIRLSDYQRYFARVPAAMRREFGAEQFLQAMVEEELLVQEAEKRGLGREPAFLRAMAVEQRQFLQRVLYERVNIVQPMVSEEELQAYFQASPYNRQVRFSLLMVRDEGQLSMILAELEKGVDFTALSMKRSQDPRILERGADMGYHRWGDTMASHAALTEKAFMMEPGEISEPLQVADGYFLIKLTDVHPVSFEQERETIGRLLLREKMGRQLLAYYDTLHARYKVRYARVGLQLLSQSLGPNGVAGDLTTVVAVYEGGELRLGGALELMNELKRGHVVGEEALRREVGRQVLVPLEIARLGIQDEAAVQQELKRSHRTQIVRRLQEQLKTQAPAPNANTLSLFYEEHKPRYEVPSRIDVRRVLADSEADGAAIVERFRAGRDTTELMSRFVNVTYGSGAVASENPVSRALRAEEGLMHGPFATDNGYIVLQVLRRYEARLPPLDEVREQIEADWSAMQIQTAVKELAADLGQRRAAEIRLSSDAANRLALLTTGDFDHE